MKAILTGTSGEASGLHIGEVADPPAPGPGECLVRVAATALNRADLLQRKGAYAPPPGASPILGLEMSGRIEALGRGVSGWEIGDAVCGLLSGGGYAEYVSVPASHLLGMPAGWTFTQGAALPEAFLTAYQALFLIADTQEGGRALLHAGASGVGSAAIQLCRERSIETYVTCSAPKAAFCTGLGARLAIDYRTESFLGRIEEITRGEGVNTVVDVIGAPYLADNIAALAIDGRIVVLATMGGAKIPELDLRSLFRKRGSIITSTLRNRSDAYKAALVSAFSAEFGGALEEGGLTAVVDSVYPWDRAGEAHQRMESNLNSGKIVLTVGSGDS